MVKTMRPSPPTDAPGAAGAPPVAGGGKARRGFTLIEMLVVMTLIALLLTLAVPRYFGSIDSGRLIVQRQNASTIRDAIDKFFADLGRYPDTLDELVAKRYLRQIPVDPINEAAPWVIVAPADPTQGNVYDVQPAAAPASAAASGSSS